MPARSALSGSGIDIAIGWQFGRAIIGFRFHPFRYEARGEIMKSNFRRCRIEHGSFVSIRPTLDASTFCSFQIRHRYCNWMAIRPRHHRFPISPISVRKQGRNHEIEISQLQDRARILCEHSTNVRCQHVLLFPDPVSILQLDGNSAVPSSVSDFIHFGPKTGAKS